MNTDVRSEAERHRELLGAAQSLIELLSSLQKHLYFQRSRADEKMPEFDPDLYFEVRDMTADDQSMSLLPDLLELYVNALKRIDDFNARQKYLSAPYLKMDENLTAASKQIVKLHEAFIENRDSLYQFMVLHGLIANVVPFYTNKEKCV